MLKARIITGRLLKSKLVGDGAIINIVDGADYYEGPYEAVPKPDEQTLPTSGKCMTEDVLVRGIPYYETSNAAGGNTIYIGGWK